jgi:hypothetical protein
MKRKTKMVFALCAILVVGLVIIANISVFVLRHRGFKQGQVYSCWELLNLIVATKEVGVLDHRFNNGQSVTWTELDTFFRNPPHQCPAGGHLVPGSIGESPWCSMHGVYIANKDIFLKQFQHQPFLPGKPRLSPQLQPPLKPSP